MFWAGRYSAFFFLPYDPSVYFMYTLGCSQVPFYWLNIFLRLPIKKK